VGSANVALLSSSVGKGRRTIRAFVRLGPSVSIHVVFVIAFLAKAFAAHFANVWLEVIRCVVLYHVHLVPFQNAGGSANVASVSLVRLQVSSK